MTMKKVSQFQFLISFSTVGNELHLQYGCYNQSIKLPRLVAKYATQRKLIWRAHVENIPSGNCFVVGSQAAKALSISSTSCLINISSLGKSLSSLVRSMLRCYTEVRCYTSPKLLPSAHFVNLPIDDICRPK